MLSAARLVDRHTFLLSAVDPRGWHCGDIRPRYSRHRTPSHPLLHVDHPRHAHVRATEPDERAISRSFVSPTSREALRHTRLNCKTTRKAPTTAIADALSRRRDLLPAVDCSQLSVIDTSFEFSVRSSRSVALAAHVRGVETRSGRMTRATRRPRNLSPPRPALTPKHAVLTPQPTFGQNTRTSMACSRSDASR